MASTMVSCIQEICKLLWNYKTCQIKLIYLLKIWNLVQCSIMQSYFTPIYLSLHAKICICNFQIIMCIDWYREKIINNFNKEQFSPKIEFAHTSIASESPGIVDMSPPITLSLKSNFFCKPKIECLVKHMRWYNVCTVYTCRHVWLVHVRERLTVK